MTLSSIIDLSALPDPSVIEVVSYQEIRDRILSGFPDLLVSDPAYKMAEVCAYEAMLCRMRVNDAAKAVLVKYASGTDLDNLFLIPRIVLDPGDPAANPPIPPTLESDDDYRRRGLLRNETLTNAGTPNAYLAYTLDADPSVKDAFVGRLAPGHVLITVLSRDGQGDVDPAVLAAIGARVTADDVKPVNDMVTVQAATIETYEVVATLIFFPNQDEASITADAQAAVQEYVDASHRIGRTVARAKLFAALGQPGVSNVSITRPFADITVGDDAAAFCTSITINDGGIDD